MNKKRILTIILINTVLISTLLAVSSDQVTLAVEDSNPIVYYTPKYNDLTISKYMFNATSDKVEYLNSYVGDSITIEIEINNVGVQDIYNLSVTGPESNIEALGYAAGSLTFSGDDPTSILGNLSASSTDTLTYSVTPNKVGTYTFAGSNITYANDSDLAYYFWMITDSITFKVYEQPLDTIKVTKSVRIDGDLYTEDGRVKIDDEFFIHINVTSFFEDAINISLNENLADALVFSYNATVASTQQNYSYVSLGQSVIFQYNLSASLEDSEYQNIPNCNATYTKSETGGSFPVEHSNDLTIFVYKPIYDGDDWTQKIPLLSIQKYFNLTVVDSNGVTYISNQTEYTVYDNAKEPVEVVINVTNSGKVEAFDIRITEQIYQDFVFDTTETADGSDIPTFWTIDSLVNSSVIIKYYLYPKINGAFKLEPTEVTYSYINQENLLNETDNLLYSNICEFIMLHYESIPNFRTEWWISISISTGIVLLAVIPIVITFVLFRKRRPTQKGT